MARPSQLSPDNILRFLEVSGEPGSTEQIARGLNLRPSDRRPLNKMLSTLKKRRAIVEIPGGKWALAGRKQPDGDRSSTAGQSKPQDGARGGPGSAKPSNAGAGLSSRDEIKGRLVLHHDGYGFVVPDTPVPRLDGDVFVPRDCIEDAMHGDRVVARIQRLGGGASGQRAEGRIVRVLGRAHPTIVGLFQYGPRINMVLPYDVRMQHQVEIPPGDELTPLLRQRLGIEHAASDRAGRPRRAPRLDELDGAVVNVELVRYPRGGMAPTGRVIEILGRPGELGVDTEIIIRKHHLPHVFPT